MNGFPVKKIAILLDSDHDDIEQIIGDWMAQKNERNRPPIPDIKLLASLSGLSTTSVSNFVRGRQGSVSKENANKLESLVQLVQYIPSRAAQSLRSSNHDTIAIALPLTSISPSFYLEILAGMKDEIEALHYQYLIFDITTVEQREEFLHTMPFLGMVDGLIIVALDVQDEHLSVLQKHQLPVVTIHNRLLKPPVAANIVTPSEQAFINLIDHHLIKYHGYRRIALVRLANELKLGTQARTDWERSARLEAYREALQLNQIPLNKDLIFEVSEHSFDEGVRVFDEIYAVNENLPEDERIQVIVCTSDTLATALYMTGKQRGCEFPITGFDNLPIASLAGITTIDQRPQQLGRLAFRQLYNALIYQRREGEFPPVKDDGIDMQMVVRQSCGCEVYSTT